MSKNSIVNMAGEVKFSSMTQLLEAEKKITFLSYKKLAIRGREASIIQRIADVIPQSKYKTQVEVFLEKDWRQMQDEARKLRALAAERRMFSSEQKLSLERLELAVAEKSATTSNFNMGEEFKLSPTEEAKILKSIRERFEGATVESTAEDLKKLINELDPTVYEVGPRGKSKLREYTAEEANALLPQLKKRYGKLLGNGESVEATFEGNFHKIRKGKFHRLTPRKGGIKTRLNRHILKDLKQLKVVKLKGELEIILKKLDKIQDYYYTTLTKSDKRVLKGELNRLTDEYIDKYEGFDVLQSETGGYRITEQLENFKTVYNPENRLKEIAYDASAKKKRTLLLEEQDAIQEDLNREQTKLKELESKEKVTEQMTDLFRQEFIEDGAGTKKDLKKFKKRQKLGKLRDDITPLKENVERLTDSLEMNREELNTLKLKEQTRSKSIKKVATTRTNELINDATRRFDETSDFFYDRTSNFIDNLRKNPENFYLDDVRKKLQYEDLTPKTPSPNKQSKNYKRRQAAAKDEKKMKAEWEDNEAVWNEARDRFDTAERLQLEESERAFLDKQLAEVKYFNDIRRSGGIMDTRKQTEISQRLRDQQNFAEFADNVKKLGKKLSGDLLGNIRAALENAKTDVRGRLGLDKKKAGYGTPELARLEGGQRVEGGQQVLELQDVNYSPDAAADPNNRPAGDFTPGPARMEGGLMEDSPAAAAAAADFFSPNNRRAGDFTPGPARMEGGFFSSIPNYQPGASIAAVTERFKTLLAEAQLIPDETVRTEAMRKIISEMTAYLAEHEVYSGSFLRIVHEFKDIFRKLAEDYGARALEPGGLEHLKLENTRLRRLDKMERVRREGLQFEYDPNADIFVKAPYEPKAGSKWEILKDAAERVKDSVKDITEGGIIRGIRAPLNRIRSGIDVYKGSIGGFKPGEIMNPGPVSARIGRAINIKGRLQGMRAGAAKAVGEQAAFAAVQATMDGLKEWGDSRLPSESVDVGKLVIRHGIDFLEMTAGGLILEPEITAFSTVFPEVIPLVVVVGLIKGIFDVVSAWSDGDRKQLIYDKAIRDGLNEQQATAKAQMEVDGYVREWTGVDHIQEKRDQQERVYNARAQLISLRNMRPTDEEYAKIVKAYREQGYGDIVDHEESVMGKYSYKTAEFGIPLLGRSGLATEGSNAVIISRDDQYHVRDFATDDRDMEKGAEEVQENVHQIEVQDLGRVRGKVTPADFSISKCKVMIKYTAAASGDSALKALLMHRSELVVFCDPVSGMEVHVSAQGDTLTVAFGPAMCDDVYTGWMSHFNGKSMDPVRPIQALQTWFERKLVDHILSRYTRSETKVVFTGYGVGATLASVLTVSGRLPFDIEECYSFNAFAGVPDSYALTTLGAHVFRIFYETDPTANFFVGLGLLGHIGLPCTVTSGWDGVIAHAAETVFAPFAGDVAAHGIRALLTHISRAGTHTRQSIGEKRKRSVFGGVNEFEEWNSVVDFSKPYIALLLRVFE